MDSDLSFHRWQTARLSRVEACLQAQLKTFACEFDEHAAGALQPLYDTIAYSLLDGGKRIRPLLVYAAFEACDGQLSSESQDRIAAAVECIHCYSLIHDDLPAMDDDDLRRGRPSCHIVFGEAQAILAGDALQSLAVELLTELGGTSAGQRLALIKALVAAAGPRGMVGGQAIDLGSVNQTLDETTLRSMHRLKTGALIRAAARMGALAAAANEQQLSQIDHYADAIGLGFQVQDDILDVTGDTAIIGKKAGADAALNKPTFPALIGLEAAKQLNTTLHQDAMRAARFFQPQSLRLEQIADYLTARQF